MRIIAQGDLERLKNPVKFYCDKCGCIFEANKDEYKIGSQYNEEYYQIQCPCCKHWVYQNR